MYTKLIGRIECVEAALWNGLTGQDYLFLRHEFLSALEQSGAVSAATGWIPQHLLVVDNQQRALAAMPLYLKLHSRGEFVFDQPWATAYGQAGLDYYPKWLTAIPFTPCYGPRVAIAPGIEPSSVFAVIFDTLQALSAQHGISSWHCLFPDSEQSKALQNVGLSLRENVQYQWLNQNYRDFADFLDTFTASKRKMIKRERRKIAEQGIVFVKIRGAEATPEQWDVFFYFYRSTYLKKGSQAYLNLAFFKICADRIGHHMLLIFAVKRGEYVGAALSFIDTHTLYGRHWGGQDGYDFLHFEACYYQGIDYCLEQGLSRFDSGAQGEHKIARGFSPVSTYSAHWLKNPAGARAIEAFLSRENPHITRYKQAASALLPFRKK